MGIDIYSHHELIKHPGESVMLMAVMDVKGSGDFRHGFPE